MSSRVAELVLYFAAFSASFALTIVLRRYALTRPKLVDMPNERSSHQIPTPRIGGVAIVLTFLAGLPILVSAGLVAPPTAFGLAGGGALVAAVGLLDDRGDVPARWRLLAHFASAAWVLAWLGGGPALQVFGHSVTFGLVDFVLYALYLVWLLNLYNFMDGVDGIAGVEATTVCLGATLVHGLAMPAGAGTAVPLLLLSVVLGFLVWNFPPAKIFMGDVGSGFLGITLGALSIDAAWRAPALFWSWVILLGVFVVDATVTLFRRVSRGEKFYIAHRSHAYQYATRKLGSHGRVTVTVGLINLFWLLPLSLLVGLGLVSGVVGLCVHSGRRRPVNPDRAQDTAD